jgi:DNA-binding transcriptional LysR family regulator
MSAPPLLDPDLLRSFVLIAEEGSFTRAAERIGRTQSAVSLQMQRLETAVGHALLARGKGGAVEITEEGRVLLAHAHRVMALNADLFAALRSPVLPKVVRFGAADYLSQRYLPEVMRRFGAAFPTVSVELEHAPACRLVMKLRAGELDLAVGATGLVPPGWPSVTLETTPLVWVGAEGRAVHLEDPLPLSLPWAECPWRPPWLKDCVWREQALSALERAGRAYRVVSTSNTVAGQLAPVFAGLAVSIATPGDLHPGLRRLGTADGLPALPGHSLILLKAETPRQPVTDVLAAQVMEVFGVAEAGGAAEPA